MSRIHCSQCGQEGHNRRNRRCPVNVQRVAPAQVANPRHLISPDNRNRRILNDKLTIAVSALADLTQLISQQPVLSIPYILGVFIKGNEFREKINQVLELDTNEIKVIAPIPIFEYFSALIDVFNTFLGAHVTSFRLVPSFQDGKFDLALHNPDGVSLNSICTANVKRTSAYFKEMSLVNDLTILDGVSTCDCPLCFDAVPATDVLVTNCKHSFCVTCIKGFATANKDKTKKPDCPMCRTDLTEFKVGNQTVHNEIREHILNL